MKKPPSIDKRQRSLHQFFGSKNKNDQNQNNDLNETSRPAPEDVPTQSLDANKDKNVAEHVNPALDSIPSPLPPVTAAATAPADDATTKEPEAGVAAVDPVKEDDKNHVTASTIPKSNALFNEFAFKKSTLQDQEHHPVPIFPSQQRNAEKPARRPIPSSRKAKTLPKATKTTKNVKTTPSPSRLAPPVAALSPTPSPSPEPPQPEQPNAYEMERLERIRRNMEVMKNLGLGAGGAASLPLGMLNNQEGKPASQRRRGGGGGQRKRPRSFEAGTNGASGGGPVRRSQRNIIGSAGGIGGNGGAVVGDGGASAMAVKEQVLEEQQPLCYDDSSVYRYVCEVMGAKTTPENQEVVANSLLFPPTATESSPDGLEGGKIFNKNVENVSIRGFQRHPGMLIDPALARAYSIDYHECSGLVAAAGKDGRVALWGTHGLTTSNPKIKKTINIEEGKEDYSDEEDEEVELDPLLSCKLHKGWISDVQLWQNAFSSSSSGGSGGSNDGQCAVSAQNVLLFSAGNDGLVCLWDITKTATSTTTTTASGLPQCLARSDDLHSGGIFSMHVAGRQTRVLTGSKDCSVVISTVDYMQGITSSNSTFSVVQRYDDLHDGCVVKCVQWKPSLSSTTALYDSTSTCTGNDGDTVIFASCGNDRAIRVVDTRVKQASSGSASGGGNMVLEGEHSTTINHIRWSPASEHMLLSASHDPTLLLHDLRKPTSALFSFSGHSPPGERINSIYQPVFVAGGAAIATAGDPAHQLSLYSVFDGKTISRGQVDTNIGATFCGGSGGGSGGSAAGAPLFCSSNRCVALFAPQWNKES